MTLQQRSKTKSIIGVLATGCLLLGALPAEGQVLHQPLDDLVKHAKYIVVGKVTSVTDGFDSNGVPYTEVSMTVDDGLRGSVKDHLTFRQFGLMKPRDMGNGYTNLNVTPDGWPRYAVGEEVMLFLYHEAAQTGLCTTVGLFQGKFTIVGQQLANAINNQGLFKDVNVPSGQLTEGEAKLLLNKQGRVSAKAFISLVRKAVDNGWFK
ncbi:hypothetical protein MJD09_22850 [bacterium]|nr:hypothetical protein [bacterium]